MKAVCENVSVRVENVSVGEWAVSGCEFEFV